MLASACSQVPASSDAAQPESSAGKNEMPLRLCGVVNRRHFLAGVAGTALLSAVDRSSALTAEWRPDLLGGVMVITGKWQDGTPMLAVPNYTRMNRVAQEHPETAGDGTVNYAPGARANSNNSKPPGNASAAFQGATTPSTPAVRRHYQRKIESKVWMQSLA